MPSFNQLQTLGEYAPKLQISLFIVHRCIMASSLKPTTTNPNNGITRVAVVQAASVTFNLEATLTKLEKLCKEAAGKGVQLVMFPEAFLSGYPKGCFFADMSDYYGKEAGVNCHATS